MRKIVFRCDSSLEIGTGHVSRSYALAEIFALNGWDVFFCGKINSPFWLLNLLKQSNKINIISKENLLDNDENFDVIVIDSYNIEDDELYSIKKLGKYVVAIVDDISKKFKADLYVSSLPLDKLKVFNDVNNALFGPSYALIRKGISEFKKNSEVSHRDATISKIALFAGGTGNANFLNVFLPQILPLMGAQQLIIFTNAPYSSLKLSNSIKIEIQKPSYNFYEKLIDTNLVISSASVSSWEFLCLDIPIAIYGIYENQKTTYEFFTTNNLAKGIGYSNHFMNFELDCWAFQTLLDEAKFIRSSSFNSSKIVDGHGPTRIFNKIIHELS